MGIGGIFKHRERMKELENDGEGRINRQNKTADVLIKAIDKAAEIINALNRKD